MSKEIEPLENILQESLISLRASTSKRDKSISSLPGFFNASDLEQLDQKLDLEFDSFMLQYIMGSRDLKTGTVMEIIGPEQVGKTTLLLSIVGQFLNKHRNSPFLNIITEGTNKMPSMDRIKSCLNKDKQKASEIVKQIVFFSSHSLKEALETMFAWIKTTRKTMSDAGIPDTEPIIVGIDTISKLMPKSEASALGYGDVSKPKTLLEESSNLEFAQAMQKWSRQLVEILEKYHVLLIIVSHQNEKIDMNSFASRFASSESSASDNKTKIGGRALNQSSTNQITIVRVGGKTNATTKEYLSHIIKMKCVKNSRNADRRDGRYELRVGKIQDTDKFYEGALNFDYGLAELFADKKILGTKALTKESFRCDALGTKEPLDRYQFAKLFNDNTELKNRLGFELGIRGYKCPEDYKSDNNIISNMENVSVPEDGHCDESLISEDVNINNTSLELKPKRGRKPKLIIPKEQNVNNQIDSSYEGSEEQCDL